jgi:hypothetical protein
VGSTSKNAGDGGRGAEGLGEAKRGVEPVGRVPSAAFKSVVEELGREVMRMMLGEEKHERSQGQERKEEAPAGPPPPLYECAPCSMTFKSQKKLDKHLLSSLHKIHATSEKAQDVGDVSVPSTGLLRTAMDFVLDAQQAMQIASSREG